MVAGYQRHIYAAARARMYAAMQRVLKYFIIN